MTDSVRAPIDAGDGASSSIPNEGNLEMYALENDCDDGDKKRKTVRMRQTAIQEPMLIDAIRRTRLGLKDREVTGKLKFSVPKGQELHLCPTRDESPAGSQVTAAVRETLCRRFDALHPTRQEDDAPYMDAVETGTEVTLVTALPPDYGNGGWRCHAHPNTTASDRACLRVNAAKDECCIECGGPRPKLRPQFAHLRLLSHGMRRQRREYERIIQQCDKDLSRCDGAEKEALDRIAEIDMESDEQEQEVGIVSTAADDDDALEFDDDEELMIDVDVLGGVWQRVNARALLPMLVTRKLELNNRLAKARAELAIMVQSAFDRAAPHVQRVTRRFLVCLHLDEVRKSVLNFARCCAAIEIQRVARSLLANKDADRLCVLRSHAMATKIQSVVRRRNAIKERNRLYAIWLEKLRNRSAVIIQCLYRCRACKKQAQLLAEERRQLLEEQENALVASLEKDSATTIQKHCRRVLAKARCENRKIEFGLHERLLMYLERYIVDGCMWTFVKSINNDYIRYERALTHTIEREEKMAKTFVEKVINARDSEHSMAWENYIQFAQKDKSSHAAQSIKSYKTREKRSNETHSSAMKLYGGPSRQRKTVSRQRKVRPKSDASCFGQMHIQDVSYESTEEESQTISKAECNQTVDEAESLFNTPEARRLAKLQHIKARLKGKYLRFDLPDGLDDSVSRFINAVMLRYKFEDPGESSVHASFDKEAIDREHQEKCLLYAEPLVQALHGKGIVFIRQLLPADKMFRLLSDLGATDEFLVLASSLLNVLHQISGGNFLNRRYLMSKSAALLSGVKGAKFNYGERFSLASFLGECGGAGLESYDDGDNPGGLWGGSRFSVKSDDIRGKKETRPTQSSTRKGRNRTWVIPYTTKVVSENELMHPALKNYRHQQLLDHRESCC